MRSASTGLMRCWCLKTEAAGKSPKAVDWLPADMEGEMRSVILHSNLSMTDMSSSDERVNDLYKWIEDVKK